MPDSLKNSEQNEAQIEIEPEELDAKEKTDSKNKFSDTFENLKENETIGKFIHYAQENTQDTIAYALLLVGILWSFFHAFYGGILVGLVAGFYFSKEITQFVMSFNQLMAVQGTARSIIFFGALLTLFIASPGIFIGGAIMIGLKILLRSE